MIHIDGLHIHHVRTKKQAHGDISVLWTLSRTNTQDIIGAMHARIHHKTLFIHPITMVWNPYITPYTPHTQHPGSYGFCPEYKLGKTYKIPVNATHMQQMSPEKIIRFVHTYLHMAHTTYQSKSIMAPLSILAHTLPPKRMIGTACTYTDATIIPPHMGSYPTVCIKYRQIPQQDQEHTYIHTWMYAPFIETRDTSSNTYTLRIDTNASIKHSHHYFFMQEIHTIDSIKESLHTGPGKIHRLLEQIGSLFHEHNIYIHEDRHLCLDNTPHTDPIIIVPNTMMDAYMGPIMIGMSTRRHHTPNIILNTAYSQEINTIINRHIRRQTFQHPRYMTHHGVIQSIRTMHAFMVSHTP